MTIYLIVDNIYNGESSYNTSVHSGFFSETKRDAEFDKLETQRKASKYAADSYWTKEEVEVEDKEQPK